MRYKFMALVTLAAAAISASAVAAPARQSASEPLRIGLILSQNPAVAFFARDNLRAWTYAAKEANAHGGVAGHKVVIVTAGTDGTTATSLSVAQKLAQDQGVHFLSGLQTSPENAAISPQLAAWNAININPLGTDDAFTGSQCVANAFRVVPTVSMEVAAISEALKKFPAKRWAMQVADYSTGHTSVDKFSAAVQANGGQVVLTQFAPLGTTDFGSYITKLKDSNADGLFMFEPGGDGVALINQGTQFGLFQKFKTVIAHSSSMAEPNWATIGFKSVGFYSSNAYYQFSKNRLNLAFRKGYYKMFHVPVYFVPADNYLAAEVLFAAVKNANSVDPQKVRAALETVKVNTIFGPVKFGADHELLRPTYMTQLVRAKKGVAWKLLSAVPASITHPQPDPNCHM